MASFAERVRAWTPVIALVACVALVVGAIGVWRLASETGERACVERAEARYPTVAVSAYGAPRTRPGSGPLKLSFVAERQRAVADCD